MFFDNLNIDNAFRKQLGDYEQSPPFDAWDNIHKSLSSDKRPLWKSFISIAASIVLVGLISTLIFLQNYNFLTDRISNLSFENRESLINPDNQLTFVGKSKQNNFNNRLADGNRMGRSAVTQKQQQKPVKITSEKEIQNPVKEQPINKATTRYAGITEEVNAPERTISKNNTTTAFNTNTDIFDDLGSFTMKETEDSKVILSSTMSPTISYRDVSGRNRSEVTERSLIAYSGGLTVGYQFSKRLKLKSGIHYSQIGQTLNDIEINSGSYIRIGADPVVSLQGSMGTYELHVDEIKPAPDASDEIQIQSPAQQGPMTKKDKSEEFIVEESLLQKMEYIKLPFLLEYKIIDNNFDLSMITGINTNLLLADGIYLENSINSKKIGDIKNLNKVTYSGTIGMGVDYRVNNNLKISMQPLFDYFLNSYNTTSGKTYPYSFGLYTGLSFSF